MISTHILDTSVGNPAQGVRVTLEKMNGDTWEQVAQGETNSDGRHVFDVSHLPGKYQIKFYTVDYFEKTKQQSFFLDTPVAFNITDTDRKYHVPLLLNPFGYSTYRGS